MLVQKKGVAMEILRFDDEPTATPKRKRSSRGLLAVAFFAMVLGVGSAFASNSITINGTDPIIDLGQGVVHFNVCDSSIGATLTTSLNMPDDLTKKSYFYLHTLTIDGLNTQFNKCSNKILNIKFYDQDKNLVKCDYLGSDFSAILSVGTVRSIESVCPHDTYVLKVTIPNYTGTEGNSSDTMVITFSDPGSSNSGIRDITIETSNA